MMHIETYGLEFGKKYRDMVTGFTGTCTGINQSATGCLQVLLEAEVDPANPGKVPDAMRMDVTRLIDVDTDQRLVLMAGEPQPESADENQKELAHAAPGGPRTGGRTVTR